MPFKKLLILTPVIVLLVKVCILDYAFGHIKSLVYDFVYATNVESVQSFEKELQALEARGYTGEEYYEFYTNMILVFNKAMGEKNSVVSCVIDEDGVFYHSNQSNEEFIMHYLKLQDNMDIILDSLHSGGKGEVVCDDGIMKESVFYLTLSNGEKNYAVFLGINRPQIEEAIDLHELYIPIIVVCILLLLSLEYNIWLKMKVPAHDPKKV